jgi:predicted secreted protein
VTDVFDRRDRTPRPPPEPEHDLQARVRELEQKLVAVAGLDGTNGKLGQLRKEVDEDKARRGGWTLWIAGMAVTALITGAGALYVSGTKDGDQARTIEQQQVEITRLQVAANDTSSTLASLRIELATLRAQLLAPRRTGGRP